MVHFCEHHNTQWPVSDCNDVSSIKKLCHWQSLSPTGHTQHNPVTQSKWLCTLADLGSTLLFCLSFVHRVGWDTPTLTNSSSPDSSPHLACQSPTTDTNNSLGSQIFAVSFFLTPTLKFSAMSIKANDEVRRSSNPSAAASVKLHPSPYSTHLPPPTYKSAAGSIKCTRRRWGHSSSKAPHGASFRPRIHRGCCIPVDWC